MSDRFRSFDEFWPHYLREHGHPTTRALHIFGTWAALCVLALGLLAGPWWLILLVPIIGYGFAWVAHLFVERNRPTTFTYPAWSLRGDLQMAWFAVTGRLNRELRQHGIG